jgi:thioredoxin reductase (NADPH)
MTKKIIVIGAGPAGVSAALYAASRGIPVCVFERAQVGGTIGRVSTVTHYTSVLPGETGASFAARMSDQLIAAGVELCHDPVVSVRLSGDIKQVSTATKSYEAPAVIIAAGTVPRRLGIAGEDRLWGKGMGMSAAHDGRRYAGKDMYVVGGSDGAIKEAIYLAQFAKRLTIIHFEDHLDAIAQFTRRLHDFKNVDIRLGTRLAAVRGNEQLSELELADVATGKQQWIHDEGSAIFVYAGATPDSALYKELPLKGGYIITNEKMQTGILGVWAAGDIRVKQVRQVATAVSDGAIAGIEAAAYVNKKDA